jgi:hypothetical protein
MTTGSWRQRDALALTASESIETRFSMVESSIMVGVGLLSIVIAASGHGVASGIIYVAIAPAQTMQGFRRGHAQRALSARTAQDA